MNYDALIKALGRMDDVEYMFKTVRPRDEKYPGSFYAHHSSGSTSGLREPSNQPGAGYSLQQRSGKTVFMSPKDVIKVGGEFQNPDMATKFVPKLDKDGKPTGKAQLVLTEDYGPKKAGTVLAEVPYTTKPQIGLNPVEINRSESPIGSRGSGIHFGHEITEVHPRPARLGGKAGVAAALLGGAGAANASELAESLLPIGLTPSKVAPGTLSPEIKAEYARKAQEQKDAVAKAQALLRSGVPMPENYRAGGKVKLI
jgi:hypothetical protein